MPKATLDTQFVSDAFCPEGKRKETYFDTSMNGLCLEVRISGGRTFYLRYRDTRGKTRYAKLADAQHVTLHQARTLCGRMRNKIAMGINPSAEKSIKRQVPTFGDFAQDRYMPFSQANKRSWKTDETLIRTHLIPTFGKMHLDEISTEDVLNMQQAGLKAGAAPGSVNRRLILLRYMFNLAWRDWKIAGVTENPTHGVRLLKENNKKERYVRAEEMARLYDEVCGSQNIMLKHIVAFLVLTGARRNEVLHATWHDINMTTGKWRIPETKSGYARHVPLNDGAMAVLQQMQDVSRSQYIFGNPNTGKPYVHIYYAWDIARRRAGLPDVRMHDLRHTFASLLVNNGSSLYAVQMLLGHTQIKTTQRYAHLTQETLLDVSNIGTAAMAATLGRSLHSDVIEGRHC
jgi:integrase